MAKKDRIKVGFFRELKYTTKYKSFEEFYSEAKPEIYKTIVDIFDEFNKTDKQVITISLSANISGMNWDTDFSFTKDQYFVMKRDILPFFEETEDYEMCSRIIKLDKELVS